MILISFWKSLITFSDVYVFVTLTATIVSFIRALYTFPKLPVYKKCHAQSPILCSVNIIPSPISEISESEEGGMERASFRRTSRDVGTDEAALMDKQLHANSEHEGADNAKLSNL